MERNIREVTDGHGRTYRRVYVEYSWDPGDNRSDFAVLHDGLWLSVPPYNEAKHPVTHKIVAVSSLPWDEASERLPPA